MRRQSLGLLMAMLAAFWAAPAAAKGCALGAVGQTVQLPVGDTGRMAMLHLPTGFSRARPAPLVLLLHGSGGTGAQMLAASKLAATADAHGLLVLAPDAGIAGKQGFMWNIPGVPTVTGKIPTAEDADDVAFLETAIDWLAANRCVDRTRVYATGLSGGGRMTSWLGCVAADRFAAIAPVVGLRAGNPLAGEPRVPDPATCNPSKPMPVIAFAGDADRTNPIQGGGAGYWQYTMATALGRWSDLDLCRTGPAQRDLDAKLYEIRYADCRDGAEVIGRITRGAGHVWAADNEAMWAFFAKYRR
ncbi:PHB depolymerase family esterase [Sphingomonas sp. HITSZ_GF]|uniref:alpha/beta hydrolase family esterase n=1 Tax=Sphingomonas sp. HITSZ_GF TaxID=3037247 RepID=UPI00240E49E7|nr:PHB depolymerase family esterase [Sphingomonas sp. HITSZ_GF]MDG2533580.1 PHB depolymerase family esterase [Sphingomonas sp. HITSZ_GF]